MGGVPEDTQADVLGPEAVVRGRLLEVRGGLGECQASCARSRAQVEGCLPSQQSGGHDGGSQAGVGRTSSPLLLTSSTGMCLNNAAQQETRHLRAQQPLAALAGARPVSGGQPPTEVENHAEAEPKAGAEGPYTPVRPKINTCRSTPLSKPAIPSRATGVDPYMIMAPPMPGPYVPSPGRPNTGCLAAGSMPSNAAEHASQANNSEKRLQEMQAGKTAVKKAAHADGGRFGGGRYGRRQGHGFAPWLPGVTSRCLQVWVRTCTSFGDASSFSACRRQPLS